MFRNIKPVNLLGLITALLIVAGFACTGCGASAGGTYRYIRPEVSISHEAKLYEPFTVTGKATGLRQDLTDADLWLDVTGAVYLDGEDRWHGPLKHGETRTIKATFAFVIPGLKAITARVLIDPDSGLSQDRITSMPIRFQVYDTDGSPGPDPRSAIPKSALDGAGLPEVAGGNVLVADTGLLLNRSASPRIEFIDSEEDLSRLQSEGLIPQELRYNWLSIDPKHQMDFSKRFLIVYYDAQRPAPGHLITMDNWGKFVWDSGTLRTNLKTYAIPIEPTQSDKIVSSVTVYNFGRGDTPQGLPDTPAFQGPRNFEFTLDGVSMEKTENLQQVVSGN